MNMARGARLRSLSVRSLGDDSWRDRCSDLEVSRLRAELDKANARVVDLEEEMACTLRCIELDKATTKELSDAEITKLLKQIAELEDELSKYRTCGLDSVSVLARISDEKANAARAREELVEMQSELHVSATLGESLVRREKELEMRNSELVLLLENASFAAATSSPETTGLRRHRTRSSSSSSLSSSSSVSHISIDHGSNDKDDVCQTTSNPFGVSKHSDTIIGRGSLRPGANSSVDWRDGGDSWFDSVAMDMSAPSAVGRDHGSRSRRNSEHLHVLSRLHAANARNEDLMRDNDDLTKRLRDLEEIHRRIVKERRASRSDSCSSSSQSCHGASETSAVELKSPRAKRNSIHDVVDKLSQARVDELEAANLELQQESRHFKEQNGRFVAEVEELHLANIDYRDGCETFEHWLEEAQLQHEQNQEETTFLHEQTRALRRQLESRELDRLMTPISKSEALSHRRELRGSVARTIWVVTSVLAPSHGGNGDSLFLATLMKQFPNLWCLFGDECVWSPTPLPKYLQQFTRESAICSPSSGSPCNPEDARDRLRASVWTHLFASHVKHVLKAALTSGDDLENVAVVAVCIEGNPICELEALVVPSVVEQVRSELRDPHVDIRMLKTRTYEELDLHVKTGFTSLAQVAEMEISCDTSLSLRDITPELQSSTVDLAVQAIPGLNEWLSEHQLPSRSWGAIVRWHLQSSGTFYYSPPRTDKQIAVFLSCLCHVENDIVDRLRCDLSIERDSGAWASSSEAKIQEAQRKIIDITKKTFAEGGAVPVLPTGVFSSDAAEVQRQQLEQEAMMASLRAELKACEQECAAAFAERLGSEEMLQGKTELFEVEVDVLYKELLYATAEVDEMASRSALSEIRIETEVHCCDYEPAHVEQAEAAAAVHGGRDLSLTRRDELAPGEYSLAPWEDGYRIPADPLAVPSPTERTLVAPASDGVSVATDWCGEVALGRDSRRFPGRSRSSSPPSLLRRGSLTQLSRRASILEAYELQRSSLVEALMARDNQLNRLKCRVVEWGESMHHGLVCQGIMRQLIFQVWAQEIRERRGGERKLLRAEVLSAAKVESEVKTKLEAECQVLCQMRDRTQASFESVRQSLQAEVTRASLGEARAEAALEERMRDPWLLNDCRRLRDEASAGICLEQRAEELEASAKHQCEVINTERGRLLQQTKNADARTEEVRRQLRNLAEAAEVRLGDFESECNGLRSECQELEELVAAGARENRRRSLSDCEHGSRCVSFAGSDACGFEAIDDNTAVADDCCCVIRELREELFVTGGEFEQFRDDSKRESAAHSLVVGGLRGELSDAAAEVKRAKDEARFAFNSNAETACSFAASLSATVERLALESETVRSLQAKAAFAEKAEAKTEANSSANCAEWHFACVFLKQEAAIEVANEREACHREAEETVASLRRNNDEMHRELAQVLREADDAQVGERESASKRFGEQEQIWSRCLDEANEKAKEDIIAEREAAERSLALQQSELMHCRQELDELMMHYAECKGEFPRMHCVETELQQACVRLREEGLGEAARCMEWQEALSRAQNEEVSLAGVRSNLEEECQRAKEEHAAVTTRLIHEEDGRCRGEEEAAAVEAELWACVEDGMGQLQRLRHENVELQRRLSDAIENTEDARRAASLVQVRSRDECSQLVWQNAVLEERAECAFAKEHEATRLRVEAQGEAEAAQAEAERVAHGITSAASEVLRRDDELRKSKLLREQYTKAMSVEKEAKRSAVVASQLRRLLRDVDRNTNRHGSISKKAHTVS
eukprot:TRINITY_DN17316_c0_g1_i1.p1 TRINITY_DN17316_c0_g1~~TRINITY_DN17316_c0_g1_i1.p1  ORF type:complete len:1770 (-),score=328.89 TRINITY_DN17316_c0_g1_i1:8-5317(-)